MTLLLVGLSLMPPSWLVPWSADVAAIAWFPLRPLEKALATVRLLLRRPVEADPALDERSARLTEERDRFRGLWYAEQLHSRELRERLEAIEGVQRSARSIARPVAARVLSRPPGPESRMFVIDAGSDLGVASGDPVVVRGDLLVGRVTGSPSAGRSSVAQLGNKAMSRIDALVVPAGRDESSAGALVPIQLAPNSDGVLSGEVTAGSGVSQGDEVRLADPSWTPASQGLRIGRIRSLKPLERNPLRLTAEVEFEFEPSRVGIVVVLCEGTP
ncbi:MAG: rod shape-determining protein MreC [Phycisphaerae bacterium]|nr:rod shape-determining protein MreC [Phycisphaerae bacterium]